MDITCPACSQYFRTQQGVNAHLSSAKSCRWWKKGKLAELWGKDDEMEIERGTRESDFNQEEGYEEEFPPEAAPDILQDIWDDMDDQDLFHFIPET